jgi:hypothetical protein
MKIAHILISLALVSFGCAKQNDGDKSEDFVIKTKVKASYTSDGKPKISFASNAANIRQLKLEGPDFGITQRHYSAKDTAVADLKCIGGGWSAFGRSSGIINDSLEMASSITFTEATEPNQHKYVYVLSIVHQDQSDTPIIQTWERYEMDWENDPNQQVDPTVKTPVESGKAQGTAGHP